MGRWSDGLCLIAGLMGAAGVALAAVASHRNGGDDVRIAAQFLLFHAVAIIGLTARSASSVEPRPWLLSASILAFGTTVFSTDLAFIGLASLRPFPPAAPIGGMGMILGWLWIVFAAISGMLRKK